MVLVNSESIVRMQFVVCKVVLLTFALSTRTFCRCKVTESLPREARALQNSEVSKSKRNP